MRPPRWHLSSTSGPSVGGCPVPGSWQTRSWRRLIGICQRLRARCHLAADLFDEPVEAVAADGACRSVGFGKLSSEAILLVDEKREAFKEHLQVAAEAYELQAHPRSEEHTSDLQPLIRISYAVSCLNTKT